jgi:hypothetical protein
MSETISNISDDTKVEFHLTEYKLLKDEIAQNQRIRLQIELFAISAAPRFSFPTKLLLRPMR